MDKSAKTKVASLTLNADGESLEASERTYVIFGLPRGGTTMVAGVARMCGLFIGEDLPVNAEDPKFNPLTLAKKGGGAIRNMRATVEMRNAEYPIWGWKYPAAAKYLPKLAKSLRNPCLILVFRDPVAIQLRNFAKGHDVLRIINSAQKAQRRNWNIVKRFGMPALLVSYEKAVAEPEIFIEQICEFLKTEPPADIAPIVEYMKAGSYKPLAE